MERKQWGQELVIDLFDCDPALIRNRNHIASFCEILCDDIIHMTRFGNPMIIHFGQDEEVEGYSLAQFIETSLISGHFGNKRNNACINIFSCKEFAIEKTKEFCKKHFKAKSLDFKVFARWA